MAYWVPSWDQLFKGVFDLKVGPNPTGKGLCPSSFQPANVWNKAGSVKGKVQLGGCSCSCQSEPLESPLARISHPEAPRLGIQVNRQGVFPSESRNFQRDPDSLELSYRGKGMQGMCAHGCTFLLRLELLPSNAGSGITSLNKGTLRSAFSGAWDRKFAECGKSVPPSRKETASCLVFASLYVKQEVR